MARVRLVGSLCSSITISSEYIFERIRGIILSSNEAINTDCGYLVGYFSNETLTPALRPLSVPGFRRHVSPCPRTGKQIQHSTYRGIRSGCLRPSFEYLVRQFSEHLFTYNWRLMCAFLTCMIDFQAIILKQSSRIWRARGVQRGRSLTGGLPRKEDFYRSLATPPKGSKR
jgi:hypothetical protein